MLKYIELINLEHIENKYNKVKCWSLLCSRRCSCKLDCFDIMDILEYITLIMGNNTSWNNSTNKNIIINLLILLVKGTNKIYCYIPILCKIFTDMIDKDIFVNDTKFINKIGKLSTIEILINYIQSHYSYVIIIG